MLTGVRQSLRTVRAWLRRTSPEAAVESRRELSERYLQDLADLVADREISPEFARRLRDDMFQEDQSEAPRLRLRYWRSYLKERTGHDGPRLLPPLPDSNDGLRSD